MTELLTEQIKTIKGQFDEVVGKTTSEINNIQNALELLIKESSFHEDNWAGQWGGVNYNVYQNKSSNNSNPIRLTDREIWKSIIKKSNIDFEKITQTIPRLTKQYRELKDNAITELSIIKSQTGYEKEIELLDSLENLKWGISTSEYIKQRRPQQIAVLDISVINRGIKTPPHISVGADLISTFSIVNSLEQFNDILKRLIKQLELKLKLANQPLGENENKVSTFVLPIIEKFHQAATQLRNRHDNRDTLTIIDEYDVQDLLHCLLKINFEDVRPEDAIPSYAGKNTRVDFLLKREKTLIEVKKTRKGLKDKEVGDQLILDVAHYKSHPDCKRLICFIYDPETLISNPRGLEDDLGRLSNDELIVEVYIRP